MQLIIKEKNKTRINGFIEWLLYMAGYTIVFILVTNLFKSIYIDTNHSLNWAILTVLIIYVLNKTIKPILVSFTIPITGLTLGLFYPCINVFILKLVDWLLKEHFDITNLFVALFFAILLSVINFILDSKLKKISKRIIKHG